MSIRIQDFITSIFQFFIQFITDNILPPREEEYLFQIHFAMFPYYFILTSDLSNIFS
ncbi:MAG: hypothetical protein Pg6B_07130 [Candidatus Azobacteroides pseudotrichonymphae]|jgi:hypothetical protein|nr:MAG: hypothetical protein Pg6B_07130 [Candidatus Azobacteroides pseudotrichonymphae]